VTHRRGSLLLAAGALVFTASTGFAAQPSSPQGESWQSIAKLPDWSGVWLLFGASRVTAEESGRYDDQGRVPLTPKYAAIRTAAAKAEAQSNLSMCLPAGVPGVMKHLLMTEFLFTPGKITMTFEDGEIRRIYTDGRKHAPLEELNGSYMGDSTGRWEGKTLVVDTVGFPKGSLWKDFGVEATINTHLVERMFVNAKGELQIDSVISDPAIFSRPYASTSVFHRDRTLVLTEPACQQNNRDTGDTIDLTPPSF
jgi:hypothetical protein